MYIEYIDDVKELIEEAEYKLSVLQETNDPEKAQYKMFLIRHIGCLKRMRDQYQASLVRASRASNKYNYAFKLKENNKNGR